MSRPSPALVLALALSISACGDESHVVPHHTEAPRTPPPPPPAALATDPEGVPNHGPATACVGAPGDARAARPRLRALERSTTPEPEAAATLLEGCAATPRELARALEKAGRAFTRGRTRDFAIAAAYYKRALEIDPAYVSARVGLAGARAQRDQIDGAMYQLDQIRAAGAAGDRAMERVYTDAALAPLRLLPRFWTWAGDPVPETVAVFAGAAEQPIDLTGPALSFTPPLTLPGAVIFGRLTLGGAHLRTLATAVSAVLDQRVTRPTSLPSDFKVPFADNLARVGGALLTRPSMYRFGDGQVVLALPFLATMEDGLAQPIFVVAIGPEAGPYRIVQTLTASAECATPALFSSPDRRALGFVLTCDAGPDPIGFGRCLLHGEGGRLVQRCGNGADASTSVRAVGGALPPATTPAPASAAGGGDDDDVLEEEEPYDDEAVD